MKKILGVILPTFSVIISHRTFFWIFERWTTSQYGYLGLLFLGAGLVIMLINRECFRWKKIDHQFLVLAFLLSLLSSNFSFLPYHILKAVMLVLSLSFYAYAFLRIPFQRYLVLLGWMIWSLPIIPLLGSTIGVINREIYVSLIHLFSNAVRKGTSLFDGEYAFHIDASCSGVQGIYLLVGLWLLMNLWLKARKVNWWSLGKLIFLFWSLNGIRVVILYMLHNYFQVSPINTLDIALGMVFFTFSIFYLTFQIINSSPIHEKNF